MEKNQKKHEQKNPNTSHSEKGQSRTSTPSKEGTLKGNSSNGKEDTSKNKTKKGW